MELKIDGSTILNGGQQALGALSDLIEFAHSQGSKIHLDNRPNPGWVDALHDPHMMADCLTKCSPKLHPHRLCGSIRRRMHLLTLLLSNLI